jgi:hypothetical protein
MGGRLVFRSPVNIVRVEDLFEYAGQSSTGLGIVALLHVETLVRTDESHISVALVTREQKKRIGDGQGMGMHHSLMRMMRHWQNSVTAGVPYHCSDCS